MERLGERSFAAVTDTIRMARQFVRESFEAIATDGSRIADVEFVASELVSNAIEHGAGAEYHISVATDDEGLVVEVTSTHVGPSIGEPSEWSTPEPSAPSGRGLGLVKALSTRTWTIHEDGLLTIGCHFEV